MKTATKFLFGGALLSAGMIADASSQQFQLSGTQSIFGYADTVVEVSGYDYYSVGTFGDRFIDGGIGDSYSYSFVNGNGTALIGATQISAMAYSASDISYADGRVRARALAAVTVDQDATLELAWNFTQEGFEVSSSFAVVDESAGVVLFSAPFESAGTASVQLFAGTNYQILVNAQAGSQPPFPPFQPSWTSFATATLIPAPASISLLGVAGFAVMRRRR